MKKKMLLDLADDLENRVKKSQFNMGSWKCKTSACAIGWYCTFHPRSDLKLLVDDGICIEDCDDVDDGDDIDYIVALDKDGVHLNDYAAIAAHFDITENEADYLFYPSSYPNNKCKDVKYVAQRIRNFANGLVEKDFVESYTY